MKVKGLIAAALAAVMFAGTAVYAADAGIKKGDYVSMGVYNNTPLMWRCVGEDDNGKLMFCDSVICYKPYDAAGEHTPSDADRTTGGSNLWSQSNIRDWLNSDTDKVNYSCQNPPTSETVWLRYNAYDDEAGFLTNFSDTEKQAIKRVTLKTALSTADASLSDGKYDGLFLDSEWEEKTIEQNYQNTDDKVFLIKI